MEKGNYKKLGLMLAISFCIMYAVMFLNVDSIDHIYFSLTRTYMSLLMVTPMAVLMLIMMPKMYMDKKANRVILFSSAAVFIASLFCLRTQTFVSDSQYIKAMIPHHSSAILTSKHANIKDPGVRMLSENIIASQEKEIAEMKKMLRQPK